MVKHLKFKKIYIPMILEGRKKTTIRVKNKYKLGDKVYISDLNDRIYGEAIITEIVEKRFYDLNDDDAIKDGFRNVNELKKELLNIYDTLKGNDILYIYHITLVKKFNRLGNHFRGLS